jgi:hypothetical protein
MKEIIGNEKKFLSTLNSLMDELLIPLSKILNEQDSKTICINLRELIQLHTSLYDEMVNACKGIYVSFDISKTISAFFILIFKLKGNQGRSQRFCKVFEDFKVRLMREYAEYFLSREKAIARCDSLAKCPLSSISSQSEKQYIAEYRYTLEQCRKVSHTNCGKFNITELLSLPFQYVLRYHLLFETLLKSTDADHSAKETIEHTSKSMKELGFYLNACLSDKLNLSNIENVLKQFLTLDSTTSGLKLILLKDYGHYLKVCVLLFFFLENIIIFWTFLAVRLGVHVIPRTCNTTLRRTFLN